MQFTAIFVQGHGDFIVVYVEEFANIVTQGKTMEDARRRVIEAVQLMLDFAREETEEVIAKRRVLLREKITVGSDAADGKIDG